MQCPACNHSASVADFGDPAKCPDCGAFYDKALIARAKRNELAVTPIAEKKGDSGLKQKGYSVWFVAIASVAVVLYMVTPSSNKALPSTQAIANSSSQRTAAPARAEENTAPKVNEYALFRIARENAKGRLKDPDSAQFRNQFVGKKGVPCGEVNSKNSFGGFTGYQRFIASGGGLAFFEGDMLPEEFESTWRQMCN